MILLSVNHSNNTCLVSVIAYNFDSVPSSRRMKAVPSGEIGLYQRQDAYRVLMTRIRTSDLCSTDCTFLVLNANLDILLCRGNDLVLSSTLQVGKLRHGLVDDVQSLLDLLLGDHQWRGQTDNVLVSGLGLGIVSDLSHRTIIKYVPIAPSPSSAYTSPRQSDRWSWTRQ